MQHIWFNQYITVDNTPIKKLFPFELFITDLYDDCMLIPWEDFKNRFNLNGADYFKWRQIIAAIPSSWKACILSSATTPLIPKVQHILQLSRPLPLEKLTSKQCYLLLIHKLTKKKHHKLRFPKF